MKICSKHSTSRIEYTIPNDFYENPCYKCEELKKKGRSEEFIKKEHSKCHGWYHCGEECCGGCLFCGE